LNGRWRGTWSPCGFVSTGCCRRGEIGPVAFALPKIESARDVPAAAAAILEACADGMLSPGEAAEIMNLLSTYGRTLADTEIEARIAALEKERKPSP
jgi:hypothetical protein